MASLKKSPTNIFLCKILKIFSWQMRNLLQENIYQLLFIIIFVLQLSIKYEKNLQNFHLMLQGIIFSFLKKAIYRWSEDFVFWIILLKEWRLKPKTIVLWLDSLMLWHIYWHRDFFELNVYYHPVLYRVLLYIWKFGEKKETKKWRLIPQDILLCFFSQSKTCICQIANLLAVSFLAFLSFL